jgi:two-component system, sensor histidine kinase SagS
LPKLLLVAGANVPEADVTRQLQVLFDVRVVDGRDPGLAGGVSARWLTSAASDGYHAVLFDPAVAAVDREAPPSSSTLPSNAFRDVDAVAALAAIGEGVCICTIEGGLVWSNDRFRGYDEQTRARILAVCRRASSQFQEAMLEQEAAGFSAGPSKYHVATPDESRFYEVVVSPIRQSPPPNVGPGRVDRVAAIIWDVTQAKRTQQKIYAIERAGAELVRLDAEGVKKKHVTERLKQLEQKIIKFSHELLHFDHLAIRLKDERTGKLELVMASGLSREAMEVELYAQKEGNGIMGYVAATGHSYLCPDVSKDQRYVMGLQGARSTLTVPLRLSDKVIGAFNVESERLAAFTEEDRQFAEIFANHVALALHILDLLLVERCATGESVTGTVQGELDEPLEDITKEAQWLRDQAGRDPALREHIDRILADVGAIRERVKDAASGPQTILGADRALADLCLDPAIAGRHVLVADDEPKMRQIIRDVLKGKGARVVTCSDGTGAIEQLELVQASKLAKFDLIISDIKMPDRNGYEVFSTARRVQPEVPVILMTGFGYDPHHSIVRASQEGLQCVLFKPFQIERLLEEVKKALGVEARA